MLDFDYIEWDDEDDPEGNVRHIAASGVTVAEVEDVLCSPDVDTDVSRSTGRPVAFGRTITGKYVVVVYEADTEAGITVIRPITAYEAPEPD